VYTADCIDLANSKRKVLCTWWVSNEVMVNVYDKHNPSNACSVLALLTTTWLETHQVHNTFSFEFARSKQSAVYSIGW